MSILGKLGHEFIDIIEWLQDSPEVVAHRFDRYQNEIKMGAKLTVREGQVAIMVNEGQLGKGQSADVFMPGMYELSTENMPVLTTLKGWKYGFNSPFKAEVYFFKTTRFTSLKWGTQGPATMRDPEFGVVRVTAFGTYSIRVCDAKTMLIELVGTASDFTVGDIEENLRGKIGLRIKEVMPQIGVPVIDLEAKVVEVGQKITDVLGSEFASIGLEICEVQVQDIGLPEEIEKAIDQQGAMKVIGDMGQFAQYQGAQALREAAQNPGAAGTMMGVGVGGMLGQSMGSMFSNPKQDSGGGADAAPKQTIGATPPPLPTQTQYFIAEAGAQVGPLSLANLGLKVSQGLLTRETLVWRESMAQWGPAGDQPDLGALFAKVPPPLPPQ